MFRERQNKANDIYRNEPRSDKAKGSSAYPVAITKSAYLPPATRACYVTVGHSHVVPGSLPQCPFARVATKPKPSVSAGPLVGAQP